MDATFLAMLSIMLLIMWADHPNRCVGTYYDLESDKPFAIRHFLETSVTLQCLAEYPDFHYISSQFAKEVDEEEFVRIVNLPSDPKATEIMKRVVEKYESDKREKRTNRMFNLMLPLFKFMGWCALLILFGLYWR